MWCDASMHQKHENRKYINLKVFIEETRSFKDHTHCRNPKNNSCNSYSYSYSYINNTNTKTNTNPNPNPNQPTNQPSNQPSNQTTNNKQPPLLPPYHIYLSHPFPPNHKGNRFWVAELWNSFEMDHQSQVCGPLVATFESESLGWLRGLQWLCLYN